MGRRESQTEALVKIVLYSRPENVVHIGKVSCVLMIILSEPNYGTIYPGMMALVASTLS
jgi:hypothetical protein